MITVIMHQYEVDLQTAVDIVGNMCKASIDRFNEERARLPSWGAKIRPLLAKLPPDPSKPMEQN